VTGDLKIWVSARSYYCSNNSVFDNRIKP
jgi:hypothetical protein